MPRVGLSIGRARICYCLGFPREAMLNEVIALGVRTAHDRLKEPPGSVPWQ